MTDMAGVLLHHVDQYPSQAGGLAVGPGSGDEPVQAAVGECLRDEDAGSGPPLPAIAS